MSAEHAALIAQAWAEVCRDERVDTAAAVQNSLIVKGIGITDPAAICVPSTDLAAERERWACWFDSCADHADDMSAGERSGMRYAAIHLRDDLVIERVRKIPLPARSLSTEETRTDATG